jgi:hypothetical protein
MVQMLRGVLAIPDWGVSAFEVTTLCPVRCGELSQTIYEILWFIHDFEQNWKCCLQVGAPCKLSGSPRFSCVTAQAPLQQIMHLCFSH